MTRGPDARPWRFDFALAPGEKVPRRTQLARALVTEIQRGRLQPGAALPGTRPLAAQLGVNRKVVVAAVDELIAQGWLEVQARRGVRVAANLPSSAVGDVTPTRVAPTQERVFTTRISDGTPDARIAPLDALARAQRRALRSLVRTGQLDYGDPAGDPRLREVLASFVNQARGLSTRSDRIVLTRGSQGALSLFALAMLKPGDVVAVEHPGYAPAWRALALTGATIVHVPVDEQGVRTDALEAVVKRRGVKAVYVTPHHQYPTTVSLSPERRMALRRICQQHDVCLVEDDYDYEYHFDGTPLLPLCATPSTRYVYIASLSKLLAPAVRLGYAVASPELVEALRTARATLDRQGDVVLERGVAELIEDGELQRHARRACQLYVQRRDHLLARIEGSSVLRRALHCERPSGGLALWVHTRVAIDTLVARAQAHGLVVQPGSTHLARGTLNAFRFGYAGHTPEELTRICKTLERCLARAPSAEG